MAKQYAQAVNGLVNLIGGPEVGLFGERNENGVVVREVGADPVHLGYIDDGIHFVPRVLVDRDPVYDESAVLEDLALAILQFDGVVTV